ncbi:MAG TPA: HAD family hydrolase [Blastocatellia bacterium]|nr:HAD family hydrolase [Blastocatellia bacterium]
MTPPEHFRFAARSLQRRVSKTDFQIITFDCYGTLIDWEGGIVRAFQTEASRAGLDLDPGRIIEAYMAEEPAVESEGYRSYREVLALTAVRVAARFGWEITPAQAEFLPASIADWQPFPDTNPALERLAEGHKLGILSNVDDDLLAATRRHFSVGFDLIVTAQQVRSYKPAHAHFREAILRAGGRRLLHAAQSFFHDVVPACELGIPVVWVNRKGEAARQGGPEPTAEVRDLTGLADLIA